MTYLSQILTFFVPKSGEDENERIILMKTKEPFGLYQNYPLLVPSPGWRSSSDHCDLSGQIDANIFKLTLVMLDSKQFRLQPPGRLKTPRCLGTRI